MALGPIPALLAAHLQATWNRSAKEMGKTGRLALILLTGLLLLVGALPLLLGGGVLGWYLGAHLAEGAHAEGLGLLLLAISVGGGLLGGITGGSRVLAWESYRIFPLRLRHLFLAELAAGLGDLAPMAVALGAGALLLGVGVARPALLPLLPLLWVGCLASLLCLQHLLGSVTARLAKHLQASLFILAIGFWAFTALVMPRTVPAKDGKPQPGAAQAERVLVTLRRMRSAFQATPPLQATRGLKEAAQGRWGAALARQAYPAAALLLLLALTAGTLRRETSDHRSGPRMGSRRQERLWSFARPATGVARLHWRILISSHVGKFGFLIPLVTLVLLKGPLRNMPRLDMWLLPIAFAYLALTGIQMQMNQFGLDGPGIKGLLLMPLRPRDILLGKLQGLAFYFGIQALTLLALLSLASPLPPLHALASLCMATCLFLVQSGIGHWTSVWMPRAMPRDSLKNSNQAQPVVWLGMALTATASSLFGGSYALCLWLAPAALLPFMALLLALTWLAYRRLILPAAARYLEQERERLVTALG